MQLLIIKDIGLEQNPQYALLGKNQSQDTFTQGDWKQIHSLSRGRKVIALFDSSEVVLTSVVIPSKNKKQLLKAIPYALEDTLAEDIEDLHFSVYQDSDSEDNISQVAIINRTALIDSLDVFKSKGITVHYALPELLTQKFEKDTWSIIYENQNNDISASVRLGQFDGFVCDQKMLDVFIPDAEDQQPSSIFSNTKPENFPTSLQTIPSTHVEPDTIEYDDTVNSLPLNLLTNLVRPSQKNSSVNWKSWQPSAILGGVLASIWVGIFFWQNNLLQNQNNQLNSQINNVYKETFPNGRLVDASAQMQTALAKLKANTGQTVESPLPLIANIGPLLKEYKDMPLSNLRYQENQLSMILESPNLTRLETFKKDAAEKRQLQIEITDSTTTANKVKATIKISPLPNTENEKQGDS